MGGLVWCCGHCCQSPQIACLPRADGEGVARAGIAVETAGQGGGALDVEDANRTRGLLSRR